MKKRLTPIVLVITALFIFLGFFVYQRYLGPMISNNQTKTTKIQLNSSKGLVLKKDKNRGDVFSIELEFSGRSSANIQLLIGETRQKLTQVVQLKKGQIEFDYTNDWYSDSCYIEVISDAPAGEQLEVHYRFLTI